MVKVLNTEGFNQFWIRGKNGLGVPDFVPFFLFGIALLTVLGVFVNRGNP